MHNNAAYIKLAFACTNISNIVKVINTIRYYRVNNNIFLASENMQI